MRKWSALVAAIAVAGCGDPSATAPVADDPDFSGQTFLGVVRLYATQLSNEIESPACPSQSKGFGQFKVFSDGTIGSSVIISNRGSESVRFGHIHHLNAGAATGPIIWWLTLPVGVDLNLTDGQLSFRQLAVFVSNAHYATHEAGLAALLGAPHEFYANFHSDNCPGGFARGFLGSPSPE